VAIDSKYVDGFYGLVKKGVANALLHSGSVKYRKSLLNEVVVKITGEIARRIMERFGIEMKPMGTD
jgi:hypothetical protein